MKKAYRVTVYAALSIVASLLGTGAANAAIVGVLKQNTYYEISAESVGSAEGVDVLFAWVSKPGKGIPEVKRVRAQQGKILVSGIVPGYDESWQLRIEVPYWEESCVKIVVRGVGSEMVSRALCTDDVVKFVIDR